MNLVAILYRVSGVWPQNECSTSSVHEHCLMRLTLAGLVSFLVVLVQESIHQDQLAVVMDQH